MFSFFLSRVAPWLCTAVAITTCPDSSKLNNSICEKTLPTSLNATSMARTVVTGAAVLIKKCVCVHAFAICKPHKLIYPGFNLSDTHFLDFLLEHEMHYYCYFEHMFFAGPTACLGKRSITSEQNCAKNGHKAKQIARDLHTYWGLLL